MMSKQRGRPSKKFRNQIERLRTKQTLKLEEEGGDQVKSTPPHPPPHGKFTRYPPRKQTWVNPLNVDIASRQNPEVPMTSPGFRYKDQKDSGSDVELISPRRHIEVHSPLRQGRRIYSSNKESAGPPAQPPSATSSSRNGYVSEAFVPILPRTAKPQEKSNNLNEFCEFQIQSVRSLAPDDHQPKRPSPAPTKGAPIHPPQYMHYPYNATTFEYAPVRQYYSLNESAKLVPVTISPENRYANGKSTFRDAGASMRTFRHENPPENNSYKIKSSALKNHEPYIIHHPSHVNRAYREIPGQYPVLYTHHPERYTGKNERHSYRPEPNTRTSRFINTAPVEIREYAPANNGAFVYERVQPRHYEKVSPRIEKIVPRERPPANAYVQYIEDPSKQHKWPPASVSTACNI